MMSPTPGVSAFPDADGNLLSWTATITGPKETPYADLIFKVRNISDPDIISISSIYFIHTNPRPII